MSSDEHSPPRDSGDIEQNTSNLGDDLFGEEPEENTVNEEMAVVTGMPKIPKRKPQEPAITESGGEEEPEAAIDNENTEEPTTERPAAEEEEEEETVDPKQAEVDEMNRRIDAVLRSGRSRRRKRTDEDDANVDERIVELRGRMRDAAYRDIDDNKDHLPAIHKLAMLPDVVEELSKSNLYEAILDNNVAESIRLWLEPLDDGSLPSIDIQNAMLDILKKLPIRRDHLRESGIGKVILFMSKCPRIPEINRRKCEQFIQHWSRMVLRLSSDFRDRKIKETQVDMHSRRSYPSPSQPVRKARVEASHALGGFSVESGSGRRGERVSARIPQRMAANYKVVPVSSLSLTGGAETGGNSRTANEKYKKLRQALNKGGRKF